MCADSSESEFSVSLNIHSDKTFLFVFSGGLNEINAPMLQLIYLIGRGRSITFTPPVVCSYLQVEWEVRRGTARLFTPDTMRSSNCRVPQQDNSSDCGLYLLQYAESFLQVAHRTTASVRPRGSSRPVGPS